MVFVRIAAANQIADIAMDVETCRLHTYRAAWMEREGRPCGVEATTAKCLTAELACKGADMGIQILGGYGYAHEYDMQRYWRDVRLYRIGPISTGTCDWNTATNRDTSNSTIVSQTTSACSSPVCGRAWLVFSIFTASAGRGAIPAIQAGSAACRSHMRKLATCGSPKAISRPPWQATKPHSPSESA